MAGDPQHIDDEARAWLESLTDGGVNAVVVRDVERRTIYVSDNAEALTGWGGVELADRIYSLIHHDDQMLLFDASRAMRRGSAEGEDAGERHVSVRLRSPDGLFRTYDIRLLNRLGDPRLRAVVAVFSASTTEPAHADPWASLLASTTEVVIIQRADLRTTYVSPNVESVLGVTIDQFLLRWTDLLAADDAAAFRRYRDEVSTAPGEERSLRVRATHADGGQRVFDVTMANHVGDGLVDGILIRARDITEQAAAEHRVHRLLQDSSGAACVVDPEGHVTWTVPGIERFIGEHRLLTREVVDELFTAHDHDIVDTFGQVFDEGPGASARVVGRIGATDTKRWVDVTLTNALDDPAIGGVIVNIRDVDEAVRASETGHRLTEVLESTTDLVVVFDQDFDLLWANAATISVVGEDAATDGTVLRRRLPRWTHAVIQREVLPALETEGTWRGELGLLGRDDVEIPVEVTVLTHRGPSGIEFVSGIARDISQRKALEQQLQAKARHDALTGLPNRSLLSERLEHAVRMDARMAVMFLDLDHFKAINDTQGHDAGDQLLVAAADRLRAALRPADLVARFGGDEFVVLLHDVADADRAQAVAARILDRFRGPMSIGEIEVFLTASAGVAVADGSDSSTLVSNADAAMYEAKARGRDQVVMFTAALRSRTVERLETAQELRAALEDDEIDVWFQPMVDTVSGLPISLEALARWIRPGIDTAPTAQFIQVAEDTGLILPLGAAVIRRTCAAIKEMGAAAEPYSFSVNLSAHQLADPMLIETLRDAVEHAGVQPRQLYCEVTESAVMGDVANSAQVLDQIRALGIGIAMDDFGTGYSSLAYLHRFPVDVLKIDREFVHGLSFDGEWDRSLAAGIISLGHSLGLTVVAEGVETQEQADILAMLDCDAMQGFLFARPVPTHQLRDTLDRLTSSAFSPPRTSSVR